MKLNTLLLVISLLSLWPQPGNQDDYLQSDGHKCGLTGNATSAVAQDINRHKNRYILPDEQKMDVQVTLAALLAPSDDEGRFDQELGAKITGFVVDVKVGGNESCNCNATSPVDCGTHIELGLSADAPPTQRVIVEVTPRLHAQMKAKGVDWTTEALQNPTTGIKGKWVEVSGWMLFDSAYPRGGEHQPRQSQELAGNMLGNPSGHQHHSAFQSAVCRFR